MHQNNVLAPTACTASWFTPACTNPHQAEHPTLCMHANPFHFNQSIKTNVKLGFSRLFIVVFAKSIDDWVFIFISLHCMFENVAKNSDEF